MSPQHTVVRTRKRRRRPARQREGAVMLIVLLIVLTATTLAATSLQSTQFELRNSGYNRSALQTEYVSEAAAMASLAWIDATALDRSFMQHIRKWEGTAPSLSQFGEPEILTSNPANANRMQWIYQQALTTNTVPPLTFPGFQNQTFQDVYGTLGPRSTYVAGVQMDDNVVGTNYVVDLYDCRRLANTGTAGYQVNQGGSGTIQYFQLYCVVTSRGRTYVPYPSSAADKPTKTWTIRGAGTDVPYIVNRFTMAHDSRGAFVTPPMIQ